MKRRTFVQSTCALGALSVFPDLTKGGEASMNETTQPNIVFVFADQMRAHATGYNGDQNVKTPNLDLMSKKSLVFDNCISGCPVCSPYRASLLTGKYWLSHGVFMNDVCLSASENSMAEVLKTNGYDTAYIGKWHLDGHGRSNYIPKERRQGFDYWKVLECTHDYNNSPFYDDQPDKKYWKGYDALAQTNDAINYIKGHKKNSPFALFLSWGPPHDPYQTAPEKYRQLYDPQKFILRGNVPPEQDQLAQENLHGYYSHISALDDCVGMISKCLDETGITDNTIFIFTSDHGDLVHSQGRRNKQVPYEESILVPMLIQFPRLFGKEGRAVHTLMNTPDIMPTLLSMCGITIPSSVEGKDLSAKFFTTIESEEEGVLLMCPVPFGQWTRKMGGKEYRGIRTSRYTYCRDLEGPWLLYDNQKDPFQHNNIANMPEFRAVQEKLDRNLTNLLDMSKDDFSPADKLIAKWGYPLDETGTVPYSP